MLKGPGQATPWPGATCLTEGGRKAPFPIDNPEVFMRRRAGKGSYRKFRRNAARTKAINIAPPYTRGGRRL